MPDWLQLILIGSVILGLVAYVWRTHENHDQERNRALWDQIGRDSKSGMRYAVHETYNRSISNHDAIESLKERIDRLERRVFNEHGPER